MVVLLITGAIDISSYKIPSCKISDTKLRLNQYLSSIEVAIEFYNKVTHIIFCENSGFGYDYSQISEHALSKGKFFEVLTFRGNYELIQKKGKGYGEGEIIKYAIENSKFLATCQSFYKLTGRLKVMNMDTIVTASHSENAFDFQPASIYNRDRSHVETVFFKTGKDFYQNYLYDAYRFVEESASQYLEHVFYQHLSELMLKSFSIYPQISGFSGTSGEKYDKPFQLQLLEKFYYKIGIHNLHKSLIQRFLYHLLVRILFVWRVLKSIISQEKLVPLIER